MADTAAAAAATAADAVLLRKFSDFLDGPGFGAGPIMPIIEGMLERDGTCGAWRPKGGERGGGQGGRGGWGGAPAGCSAVMGERALEGGGAVGGGRAVLWRGWNG